jgi:hypothetical protein
MKLSVKRTAIGPALAMSVCLTNSTLAADTRIDVSQMVTKTDAESILGEKVKDPTPRNAEGRDGYYSKCNYYGVSRQKSLVIRVYQQGDGAMGPQRELDLVAASATGPLKPVDGLGDKAEMFSGADDSGAASQVLMLYVAKGNLFITIGLGGIGDESVALAKAKEVANKILAKL